MHKQAEKLYDRISFEVRVYLYTVGVLYIRNQGHLKSPQNL